MANRCHVCRWPSPQSLCDGCEDQANRLKLTPAELWRMALAQNGSDHDRFLTRAIEVGLLEGKREITPSDRVFALKAQGLSGGSIAIALGMKRDTVYCILERGRELAAAVAD